MVSASGVDTPTLSHDTLKRVAMARLLLVLGEWGLILTTPWLLNIRLPLAPMLAVAALHGAHALLVWTRPAVPTSPWVVFPQLFVDACALAALVYFSGGYANPFISLLLLPVILCAVAMPGRHAWLMGLWVALLYTILARYYLPLRLEVDSQTAINLHLAGMWLNFLFTVLLVAAFVASLAAALRQREAELARAREKSLRDEQLFSLGMQAAAAAHDLATPLSALSVTLNELEHDYAGDDELTPPLTLMRGQANRMRAVLDRLALAAGAARREGGHHLPLSAWLADFLDHWRLMWPGVAIVVDSRGVTPSPAIRDDPILVSVLANILNNAARASPEEVRLEVEWDARRARLRILDRGQGIDGAHSEEGGWGVGIPLARAALERYGAALTLSARSGGGTEVTLDLPLAALRGETP
jgi:two-component system sensor histidine kinase RegB